MIVTLPMASAIRKRIPNEDGHNEMFEINLQA